MTGVPPQRALVLDLDGVLLDTRPVMREAWQAVRAQHGVEVPFEAYEQHLGRPFDDIMERLGLTEPDRIHQTYTATSKSSAVLAEPFDGVLDVLYAFVAAGWLLAVVTSKPLDRAAPLLARLGCPFASVRAPARGGQGRCKPAPDPLLLALVDLSVDPRSAVYVGDMAVDHECARRAGVPYVHAAWGYGRPGSPAPRIANAPKDLLEILDEDRWRAPFIDGSLL
ncbi:HAD family hydrolase [Streptomyces sp. NPDC093109]|uniref:HAD family hydrolase n=1 Tax=Streptomyces sp. NPDC093109 TaxID=3154977 RepID=UPI00344F0528